MYLQRQWAKCWRGAEGRWNWSQVAVMYMSCFSSISQNLVGDTLFFHDNYVWGFHNSAAATATAAKSLQSCLTLCDPIDSSLPGSPIPGILQARTLEWVAMSFSNGWKWKVKVKSLSHVRLLVTPWTAAFQAPPSMGFSRQEYWSGVPLPSPIILLILFNCIYSLKRIQ